MLSLICFVVSLACVVVVLCCCCVVLLFYCHLLCCCVAVVAVLWPWGRFVVLRCYWFIVLAFCVVSRFLVFSFFFPGGEGVLFFFFSYCWVDALLVCCFVDLLFLVCLQCC